MWFLIILGVTAENRENHEGYDGTEKQTSIREWTSAVTGITVTRSTRTHDLYTR